MRAPMWLTLSVHSTRPSLNDSHKKGVRVNIGKQIAVGFGGIVAAVAVSLGSAPAAHADTINVVQTTRYWWDNAVYYEYGPFRDADHCIGFAKSNPQLSELFMSNEAGCSADAGSPWHLNAPVNIL